MAASGESDLLMHSGHDGREWKALHLWAAAAAVLSALFIPVQVAVFLAWPPPLDGTATDWFMLLREHPIAGLVDLDLLLVADNVMLVPILLALYVALRSTYPSLMLLALVLGLVGVAMYFATNPAIQMVALGDQYAAATTDAQRQVVAAAGTATLALWQGTAFHVGYVAGSTAGVLLGAAVLRSSVFSRPAGWLGIAANAVGMGLYVPTVGVFIAVFSVLFLEAWYVLIAVGLYRIWRSPGSGQRRAVRTSRR